MKKALLILLICVLLAKLSGQTRTELEEERIRTLEEIEYDELLSEHRGKTVGELHIRAKTGATVIGYKYKDKGFTFNPGPDTVINQDSILIVLGTVQTIENLRRVFLKHDDY